jgi:hypothetical protein
MSLRQKTLLIIALTLAGLILVLALLVTTLWFSGAAQLEQRDQQQALSRVTTALSGELADLDRFAADWAGWDDTYAFMADANPAYIDSNLTVETFLRSYLHSILFVDLNGQIVYGATIDPAANRLRPVSTQWAEYLPALTKHLSTDSAIMSVISLDGQPSLVAARPILTSDYAGPIRGTVIMERRLTAEQLHNLAQIVGLQLTVHDPHAAQLPEDFQQAYRVLAANADQTATYAQPVNDYLTELYSLLQAANGEPALLLRIEVPRTAYQYALSVSRVLSISLLAIGVIFGALTLIWMDRFVLRRLAQLSASVEHITASGDLSARAPITAHDELSRLAHAINGLLAGLQQAQQDNERLLYETRRQLGELSLLHTAAVATSHSSSLDAALHEIAQSVYDAFEAVNALVLLCDPDGARLTIRASVGLPAEVLPLRELTGGQGISGAVVASGETIVVADVARDARYYAVDPRTRSELCVPLKVGGRVSGLINVESDQPGFFTAADRQLLETLAHNLSMIVENLRLLEELRAANEQLTERDRLQNQFIANMSHELRTPLNAILGFSELLSDEAPGPLNDEQRDYVAHIYTSGQHLLALINDILDLSKLQANRLALERRTAHLAEIVAAAQTFVWPMVQRKRQILSSTVSSALPGLYVDPLRVKQVLINLLSNACKFTPANGQIAVLAEVWRDGWLRVGVRDTGPGIPPAKQAEVFEEFMQIGGERVLVERGTGLGLTIARRLVELHGGQIWIESTGRPGEGAIFYFTLPLADDATRPPRAVTRLLVIDDDQLIIDLLQSILLPPDYEVLGVVDPTQALERVRRDRPDVVVLDLTMPEQDGFQLLTALQRDVDMARLPVVVLTAKELSAAERAELDRVAQAVLTKTQLRRATLLATIQQARQANPAQAV